MAIVTLVTGPEWANLAEITLPSQREYAERLGVDFIVLKQRAFSHPGYDKWQIAELFDRYARLIYIDADIIIRPDCPDLFALVLPECVGGENELQSFPERAQHLSRFSEQLGLVPISCPFYLNAGLFVVSNNHRSLFRTPELVPKGIPRAEQSHFNYRLISERVPIRILSPEFNDRRREAGYLQKSFILHYSVMPIAQKIEHAQRDLAAWGHLTSAKSESSNQDRSAAHAGTSNTNEQLKVRQLKMQARQSAQRREFDKAIRFSQEALQHYPTDTENLAILTRMCMDANRLEDAEKFLLQQLELEPNVVGLYRQLASLRKRLGNSKGAVDVLRNALTLMPNVVELHVELAGSLVELKQKAEAKATFIKALELEPDHFDAHNNLAVLLQDMQQLDGAIEHLQRAVELKPTHVSGLNNLGVALTEKRKFSEAIELYNRALALAPSFAIAWNNLGNALRSRGRSQDAAEALHKAIALQPDYAEAHNNLAITLAQMEDSRGAISAFDKALFLKPDYPEAHMNRGLQHLLLGDFPKGWADYEWRWHEKLLKPRRHELKRWDGSPLVGKKVLVFYEQGLGDTFHFIRYASELKARGATVVFECQPPLRRILSRTPGIDEFILKGQRPPPCDFGAPLLSLPGAFQANLENLPSTIPYVTADPKLKKVWQETLQNITEFRIGIAWQGNPEHRGDWEAFDSFGAIQGISNARRGSSDKSSKGIRQGTTGKIERRISSPRR